MLGPLQPKQVRASLASAEGRERVKFLGASWHLDKTRDPKLEFLQVEVRSGEWGVPFRAGGVTGHSLPAAKYRRCPSLSNTRIRVT